MTFLQLEYVAAVVQEGTILAAAEKLHVSHPSISKAITALENELGVKLFLRTTVGTTPTEAGILVAQCAENIRSEMNALRDSLQENATSSLSLSIFSLETTPNIMETIDQIKQKYPNISLLIHQDNLSDIIASVLAQEIDMGIVLLPKYKLDTLSSKLRYYIFRQEILAVACSANHPLAERQYIEISELPNYSLALHDDKLIMDILQNSPMSGSINVSIIQSNSYSFIKQMILQRNAISLYTTVLRSFDPQVINGDIRLIPIIVDSAGQTFEMSFACLSHAKHILSPCEKGLIKMLRKPARE